MFRINIGGDSTFGTGSLIEWANNLLPPLFLLTLTWFLRKLLKLLKKDKCAIKEDNESPQLDEDGIERAETILHN